MSNYAPEDFATWSTQGLADFIETTREKLHKEGDEVMIDYLTMKLEDARAELAKRNAAARALRQGTAS